MNDRAVLGFVSTLFVAPNLILAAGLRPLPGAVLACACAAALAILLRNPRQAAGPLDQPLRPDRLAGSVALAAVILILGGETHLLYANPDWLIRDAVLADLVRGPFPVGYEVEGGRYILRAPLGMYLVPTLAGRIAGLEAAHGALVAQNSLLLGMILYVLMSLGRGWAHLAVLILFGGLGILWRVLQAIVLADPGVLLLYARPLDEWNALFQYSSSITQFFWVPNHALPGWWLAALLILCARRAIDVATVGVSVGAMLLWSPLAILPALPALLWLASRDRFGALRSAPTWLGALTAFGFLPVAAYVTVAAGTIDHGLTGAKENFAAYYALFILLQLPACAFVIAHRRRLGADLAGPFAVSTGLLLALPFFSFGPNNDLVLRASLAALVIVAFCFGDVLIALVRTRDRAAALGITLVVLGAAPAVVEVARALLVPSFAISDCTLMQATRELGGQGVPANYMAQAERVPAWLMAGPGTWISQADRGPCWPDLRRPDIAP